jgi:hypothetical protein
MITPTTLCLAFLACSAMTLTAFAGPLDLPALPPAFEGLWVTDESRECPQLERDENAYAMGEGALLLRGTKYYAHESICRITGQIRKGCCDHDNQMTVAANFACGRARGRVLLFLERDGQNISLLESFENASSGPSVRVYRRKCPHR